MVIRATVEDIVFRNEDNGYTVVNISYNDELYTAVGKFPVVSEGEYVELSGNFIQNVRYGEQFACDKVTILRQNTKEGIVRYLSSGLIYGIGPITAQKIVDKFGLDTLDIIEFNPERLVEVNGVSKVKAEEICKSFSQIKVMQQAVMFLQEYGISTNLSVKIYNKYKDKTISTVQTNPYILVEDIDGVGFLTADRIAANMGVERDSIFRLRAGIMHTLKEMAEKSGNTYLTKSEFIYQLLSLLGLSLEEVGNTLYDALNELQIESIIKLFKVDDEEVVMLSKFYNIEKQVASKLTSLMLTADTMKYDVSSEIKEFERVNKITFHEEQINAVVSAINNGVCVITGGPGTGKTTIIKCIIDILQARNVSVKLLAPTGRAAKRLSESTGQEASTIHRALDLDFTDGKRSFSYNEETTLPYDCIIIDEVSMVDVSLMNYLIKAIKKGSRLILVGDKDQLPSVGAGNVFADILRSKIVTVSYLTKVFRQEDNSLIIVNAHKINMGEMPTIDNTSKDFFFQNMENPEDVAKTVIDLMVERIPNYFTVPSSKIQILAPLKAGVVGVDNLNKNLQNKLNPSSINKSEIVYGKTIFRLGDKVMQIANNYQLEWIRQGTLEEGTGVYNGDIGTIVKIVRMTQEVTVVFEDGRQCVYPYSELNQLVLSYAITIHKSQGSEFDAVIIPVVSGAPMLMTRNLIYTAVTRAKKLVVIVGQKSALARMVKNNYTAKRNSMLCTFLVETFEQMKKMYE